MLPVLSLNFRKLDDNEIKLICESIKDHGYAKVTSYFDVDQALDISTWLTTKYQELKESNHSYNEKMRIGTNDKLILSVHKYNSCFLKFIDCQIVREVLIEFLNDPYYTQLPPNAPNFNLGYFNARSSGNQLPLHIDNSIPYKGSKPLGCQCAYYFSKSDTQNGCTIVVPKSHMSGTYADRTTTNTQPIVSNPGDCVIWDSRLWHGTCNNKTDKDRWALIATYQQWFVKQSLALTNSLTSSQYKSLNNVQKQLFGFCSLTPKDEYSSVHTKKGYDDLPEDIN